MAGAVIKAEYGPGWEDWRDQDHGNKIERIRRRGGTVVTKPRQDGSFEIEIPTVLLTRMLAGDITAEVAWGECGSEIRGLLQSVLVHGHEITGASIEESDPKSREETRLCLKFGPPQSTVIREKKD